MDKKLEISEQYLLDCLKGASNKMVGEVMSKHETLTNPDEIKTVVKNTIYENFRDLKAQILAFDSGVKFCNPKTVQK